MTHACWQAGVHVRAAGHELRGASTAAGGAQRASAQHTKRHASRAAVTHDNSSAKGRERHLGGPTSASPQFRSRGLLQQKHAASHRMTSKPQAPPPLPARPAKLVAARQHNTSNSVEDRRALLRYVHELHGGTGAPGDAALDAVSVQNLLTALRSGSSYATADGLLFPGTLPARRGATASAALAPVVAAPVAVKAGSQESYKSTSESDDNDGDSDDDGTSASSRSTAAAPKTWLGPQEAPMALDVDDRGLGEEACSTAAYQSFVAGDVLSSRASPLHDFVRAQLGVDPALAKHASRTLAGSGVGAADALTLKAHLFLLTAPGELGPKELRRFQQAQGSIIAASLPPALDALRERLLAAEPTAVAQACAHLDRCGWGMPARPAGVLVYQALVRCQWDDLDESNGEPVEEAPLLVAALQPLWPSLGCTARAHAAHCIFSAYSRWLAGGAVEALRTARCGLLHTTTGVVG